MALKYTIKELEHGSGDEFTSYYYNKHCWLVYKVKHGDVSEARVRADLKLNLQLRMTRTLPRFVMDNILKNNK